MQTGHEKPSEERARQEKVFFDKEYTQFEALSLEVNPVWFAKYKNPSDLTDWRQLSAVLMGDLREKRILDYGCGIGEETTYFAMLGAEVHSTEVSETAISLAKQRVQHNHVSERVSFYLVSGTRLGFPDNFFDVIHGLGVLHHVGLDALQEIRRVLKPGGKAVFLEHMGSSSLLVPLLRRILRVRESVYSQDERPLDFYELPKACEKFAQWQAYPYHVTYRLRRFLPSWLHRSLLKLDHGLLRSLPLLNRYAGGGVIFVVK